MSGVIQYKSCTLSPEDVTGGSLGAVNFAGLPCDVEGVPIDQSKWVEEGFAMGLFIVTALVVEDRKNIGNGDAPLHEPLCEDPMEPNLQIFATGEPLRKGRLY